jgi:glycosyltransferase involved in cell wall biosynthesis
VVRREHLTHASAGDGGRHEAGQDLHFFPDWRRYNPYQDLLFADLPRVGAAAVAVGGLLRHLTRAVESPVPGVLNVHWTTPVLASVDDDGAARGRVARLEQALTAYRDAGGRLVWTVHNVLPHDARHHEAEVLLARALADHADVVHVLTEATAAAAAPFFRLDPERTVCIPHSSYLGVYPDTVSRAEARQRLGLRDDDRVLLALGRLRPYKGLDRLLDLVEQLHAADPRLRLLVAGALGHQPGSRQLAERLASVPGTMSTTRRVRDDELQVWMRAADLAVLPYLRVLNSGAFLLAETFGLPVVAPRVGALAEREGEAHVRLFGDDDFDTVVRDAVRDLVVDVDGAASARASAVASAAARPPAAMAAAFADLVAALFTEP